MTAQDRNFQKEFYILHLFINNLAECLYNKHISYLFKHVAADSARIKKNLEYPLISHLAIS
jgi:hypothetical protein